MDNFLNGGINELEEAKRAVIEEAEKQKAAEDAQNELRAKEKDLNAQRMFMSDKIESTIKNRRNDLEKNHDSNIKEADRDVKTARKNKKDALNRAIDDRVKNETALLVKENKQLRRENKSLFKQNKLPSFCNSRYYYAMFAPKAGTDFLIFALSVVIAVALIPNVVCYFMQTQLFYKVLMYIAIVVFFALIYFIVLLWTKPGSKSEAIEAGRPNMNKIKANKKEIKKLAKGIKKDENEGQYGLDDYDSEIARRQSVYNDKYAAKDAAMKEFDEVTAVQIKNEIEKDLVPKIQNLEAEIETLKVQCEDRKNEAKAAEEKLMADYIGYLGEKYTTPDKIDELIAIINEGRATTIMQAMDVANGSTE